MQAVSTGMRHSGCSTVYQAVRVAAKLTNVQDPNETEAVVSLVRVWAEPHSALRSTHTCEVALVLLWNPSPFEASYTTASRASNTRRRQNG